MTESLRLIAMAPVADATRSRNSTKEIKFLEKDWAQPMGRIFG
jgi:hypothetical protein